MGSSVLSTSQPRRSARPRAGAHDALAGVGRHREGDLRQLPSARVLFEARAGRIPEGHWYNDHRQGGRLLGEVCHFIDTCCALVDDTVTSVYATNSGHGEALLDPDVSVLLRFEDGSQASILYASSGHSSTPKERLEVLGRGHTVLVDDFTRLDVDGKSAWSGSQDKGHRASLANFCGSLLRPHTADPAEITLGSTRATLRAVEAMLADGTATEEGS